MSKSPHALRADHTAASLVARGANLLGALATAVHDELLTRLEQTLALSAQEAAALIVIGCNRGRSVDFLSGALRLSHSGCVRLVDKLAHAALVERRTALDRRVAALHLTAAGRARMQSVLRERRAFLQGLLQTLSPHQQRQLSTSLDAMLRTLPRDDAHAEAICRYCEAAACPQDRCPVTLGLVR
jgi:DNA-binding MarR family transcriptional regulator